MAQHAPKVALRVRSDGVLETLGGAPVEIVESAAHDFYFATNEDARRLHSDLAELREVRQQRARGTVFKRKGSKYWQLKIPVGDRWVYESSGTTDKREAERRLSLKQNIAAAGRLPTNSSFEQAIGLLLNDARVRGLRSFNRMARAGRALLARLEGLRAKDVTHSTLVKYAADRQAEGIAPDTVKLEMDVARRALKLAVRENWITVVPEFPRIAHLHVRSGFFDPADWHQVREHLSADFRDAADFAFLSGWRLMEVLGLKWSNVDNNARLVRLDSGTTKTGAGRVLAFEHYPHLAEVIERRMAIKQKLGASAVITPWVFCFSVPLEVRGRTYHPTGAPLFKSSGDLLNGLRDEWIRACERSGLPGRMFHDLRRSAARNFERAGIPRSVARKLGGWTERFTAVTRSVRRAISARPSAMLLSTRRAMVGTREKTQ